MELSILPPSSNRPTVEGVRSVLGALRELEVEPEVAVLLSGRELDLLDEHFLDPVQQTDLPVVQVLGARQDLGLGTYVLRFQDWLS